MPSPLDAELRHHAKALRGLARSLVGGDDADDLLQDAALQALQQQRPPASLRAWLRRVLRHLAGRHRRDLALRHRREGEASPQPQAVATDRVAEHREILRKLDAALLALPEPYQGTLLLRYFEDLTPSGIAEQTKVPLATVKSRLQRGLQMLRERLDRDGDWRAGLVLAFGLERALPVAAGVAAGVMIMASVSKLAIGGGALVLAVVAALLVVNGTPPPAAPMQSAAQAPVASASAGAADATTGQDPGWRTEAATNSERATAALATIRGRCVDEQGLPLANVAIQLSAHRTDQRTVKASDWQDRSATSGDDGRFAFHFAVPEHFSFMLDFHCVDRCDGKGSWLDLQAGQIIDAADVVLPLAMPIAGRVVDTAGKPVGGVMLTLRRDRAVTRREVELRVPSLQPTGDDGSFMSRRPPGRYLLRVTNRQLARGPYLLITLDPELPTAPLEIVVCSDADRPPISGAVVDETGAPIANAEVRLGDSCANTDRDGSFTIRPGSDADPEGPFALETWAPGRDRVRSGPHALGDSHVCIVLPKPPLPRVRVIVRADDTGEPVTGFAVDIALLDPGRRGPSGKTFHSRQHWDQGIAVLPDVRPGDHAVYVDPGDGPYAPSTFVPVHVDGDTDVTVRLTRRVERLLSLKTRTGAPIRASIELLDGYGQTPVLQTIALPMPEWNTVEGPPRAVLLQRGITDERGELLLRGPAGRDLALRLGGSGIARQLAQPIRLDGDGPLVITPQAGGRWTGRLLPAEVAAALFTASQPKPGEKPGRRTVGIQLSRAPDEQLLAYQEPLFPYAADGTFDIDGIPAGTWTATVVAMGQQYRAAEVTVTDSQTLQQDLDVEALRPVHVTLQFFVDGKPLASATANVFGEHAPGTGTEPMRTQYFLRTDDDGKVSFVTFAGSIGCELHGRRDGTVLHCMSPAIAIPAGATFAQVVDLRLGGAHLRVSRPDGQPAANLSFGLLGVTYCDSSFTTDADGRAELHDLPAGTHRMRTRIRSLSDRQGQDAYARQFGWKALQDAWLEVSTIDICSGAEPVLELRLPPAWDR